MWSKVVIGVVSFLVIIVIAFVIPGILADLCWSNVIAAIAFGLIIGLFAMEGAKKWGYA